MCFMYLRMFSFIKRCACFCARKNRCNIKLANKLVSIIQVEHRLVGEKNLGLLDGGRR